MPRPSSRASRVRRVWVGPTCVRKIEQSQRIVARAARQLAGHETDPCPLEHPWVPRLRCGEWLLFAGVHDLMHLEQLHGIAAGLEAGAAEPSRST